MTPRTVQRFINNRLPRHCEFVVDNGELCSVATYNNKAYCTKHVKNHEYVSDLLKKMEDRIEVDNRVVRLGEKAVDLESISSIEIMTYINTNGPTSHLQLSKQLGLSHELVAITCGSFVKTKTLSVWRIVRGVKIYGLDGRLP